LEIPELPGGVLSNQEYPVVYAWMVCPEADPLELVGAAGEPFGEPAGAPAAALVGAGRASVVADDVVAPGVAPGAGVVALPEAVLPVVAGVPLPGSGVQDQVPSG
jgi:hypothetical protein